MAAPERPVEVEAQGRGMQQPGRTRSASRTTLLALAAAAYLAITLWITLGPVRGRVRTSEGMLGVLNPATWAAASTWTSGSAVEFAGNVLLFVPAGLLAAALLPAGLRLAAPLALTLAIEVVQIPLAERASDPRDLVANGLGALLGVLAVAVARLLAHDPGTPHPPSRTASRTPV